MGGDLAEDMVWSGDLSDTGPRSLLSDAQELALWEQQMCEDPDKVFELSKQVGLHNKEQATCYERLEELYETHYMQDM